MCARCSLEQAAADHGAGIGRQKPHTESAWHQDSRQDSRDRRRKFRLVRHHSGYRSRYSARRNDCGSVARSASARWDSEAPSIAASDSPVRRTEILPTRARRSNRSGLGQPLLAFVVTSPAQYRRSNRFLTRLRRTTGTTWSSQRCS